ncbi:DUF881 domain-containing protein [Alicyclobacillus macrosporangiidus]|uniref:DUF881 domain-containing protein n=1 Tax=Alicyclobacillus macrosporangiidus TaxID=392015 RepID=UPI0026ED75E3|nr:DUF881 domain-containing protein [Alicyclobacillus macrosporangiidus]
MIATRTKLTLSLTVVAVVLGFMISVQYKQQASARVTPVPMARDTDEQRMVAQLDALKQANAQAQKELADITSKLSVYEKQSAGSDGSLKQLQQMLQDERILAGLTAVTGPGVSVTLMDGVAKGGDVSQYLTHDWDIRSVINELFTAGAEAVSINGYRVVATSGVFCTGPVVRVNDHRIGAPFVIQAIGDPQTLKSALTQQGGVLDALRQRGVNVSDPQIQQVIKMPPFTAGPTAGGDASGDGEG